MSGIIKIMQTQTLTQKQKQILKYIYQCIKSNQLPPTIREIAHEFGFSSTGTVRDHLKALVHKGYIKISENKSRAIEIIREALMQVPVLGQVRAGQPIYAVEDLVGYLNLDEVIFPDDGVIALRVKGDSMIGAGIMEGDFILVKRQEAAKVGEVVVALIGEEVTVKTLRKREGKYFLDPANPQYDPIPVGENVSIFGIVINVIRKY